MVMTRRASTCLSLLALLSSFPVSLGAASHISGSSLIGVSSVSEILDKFFQKQELSGGKPPLWKSEAQAVMSLLQDMKAINETTQERVNEHVTAIIDELKPDRQQQIMGQESAKADLDDHERDVRAELRDLEQQLTRVKTFSGDCGICRANVTTQVSLWYSNCTDNDRGLACPAPLGNAGVCGSPSTADFELVPSAKQQYTCDFEAGQTAKECVATLWAKVNMTRQNLTNKYLAWAAKKRDCERHRDRCDHCDPLWRIKEAKIEQCDHQRNITYDAYCTLQTRQEEFCTASSSLHDWWTRTGEPGQVNRSQLYSDLDYLICVFEEYLVQQNFTQEMLTVTCTKKGAGDFYAATTAGELVLPTVDASDVPGCSSAVSHSSGTVLYDMTGLINEFQTDGHGSTVSTASGVYSPAAGDGSFACTALMPTPPR